MSSTVGRRELGGSLHDLESLPEQYLLDTVDRDGYFEDDCCGSQEPGEEGYVCTREPGHGGPHVAHVDPNDDGGFRWLVAWDEETGQRRENPEHY